MRDGNEARQRDLTKLAERQHGVVSLKQLEAMGYTRSDAYRRVRAGSLQRTLPGVYRIAGAVPTAEQRAVAAVLWAGNGAVVSHSTAGALWGLLPRADLVHVTTARPLTSPPRSVRAHAAVVPARDRGKLRGVPVTGVARTLLDVAATRPEARLLPLVESAVLDGLTTAEQVRDVLARNPGRRGSRRLAQALDTAGSSFLERRVDGILRGSGLPPFVREHPVGNYRLDFAWPATRVGVEADGRRWHSSPRDFARDRAKHNDLVARGWRVVRVTRTDADRPGAVIAAVGDLLIRGAGS